MRTRKLDQIVVVDLEATCWEDEPPEGERSEIIEVGACLLDLASGTPGPAAAVRVRPVQSRVSEFCTALTSLTQEEVDAGGDFAASCDFLREQYGSRERLWASYGDWDREAFARQCRDFGVPYPFGDGHINIKSLFAAACGFPREIGILRALEHLGLPFTGTHHRAADDAWNAAVILGRVLTAARGNLPPAVR